LVAWPLGLITSTTFADGWSSMSHALSDPVVTHALQLTATVAVITVVVNVVFGVGVALLLVRYRFPGRRLLGALVDLPLSVSPVVVGLALTLAYGNRTGWFGGA
ncbi:MAG TPA: hypothetical protein PLV68_13280, partial [Ilumatobacteraceae bacterium]|nr:hypothetical protein [Ilumatobacteraceae bacterium]